GGRWSRPLSGALAHVALANPGPNRWLACAVPRTDRSRCATLVSGSRQRARAWLARGRRWRCACWESCWASCWENCRESYSSRRQDLREVHGANRRAEALKTAADLHQAGTVDCREDVDGCLAQLIELMIEHCRRDLGQLDRERATKPTT